MGLHLFAISSTRPRNNLECILYMLYLEVVFFHVTLNTPCFIFYFVRRLQFDLEYMSVGISGGDFDGWGQSLRGGSLQDPG